MPKKRLHKRKRKCPLTKFIACRNRIKSAVYLIVPVSKCKLNSAYLLTPPHPQSGHFISKLLIPCFNFKIIKCTYFFIFGLNAKTLIPSGEHRNHIRQRVDGTWCYLAANVTRPQLPTTVQSECVHFTASESQCVTPSWIKIGVNYK